MDNVSMTNLADFVSWLNSELEKREFIQADISRPKTITDAAVSNLFSGKTKKLTFEMCEAISKATGIPLEDIYIKAGKLPQKINREDPWMRDSILTLSKIPIEQRETVTKVLDAFIPPRTIREKAIAH